MPRQRKPNPFLCDIKTVVGNTLLETLLKDGWTLRSEYDVNGIDKGIDYDFFELGKEQMAVFMEWDNWDEWSINVNCEAAGSVITDKLKNVNPNGN